MGELLFTMFYGGAIVVVSFFARSFINKMIKENAQANKSVEKSNGKDVI